MTANSAISIGILCEAVDAAAKDLAARVSTIAGNAAVDNAVMLEMLNEADMAHRTLRAGLQAATTDLWDAIQSGGRGSREQRSAVYGLIHHAVGVARRTISELYGRTSRSSFYQGHPLERALRNIHAVHYGLEPLRQYQHSAALTRLGRPPTAPGA